MVTIRTLALWCLDPFPAADFLLFYLLPILRPACSAQDPFQGWQ